MTTASKTANRLDAHRPAEMVPAHYVYLASSFGYKAEGENGQEYNEIEWDGSDVWEAMGSPTTSTCAHAKIGQCDHCGAHHSYQTILQYLPTGELLSVGHTCARERFGNPNFKHVIAAAARNTELKAARNANIARAVAVMSAEVKAAYDWAQTGAALPIAADIASKVPAYGPLSVKQGELLVRLLAQSLEVAAALEAKTIQPCPTGRVTMQGTVKTVKYQDNGFGGGSFKMLVEAAEGYKVWGSVPAALAGLYIGDVIKFTATIEPKRGDETFGFFTRPAKSETVLSINSTLSA